MSKSRPAKSGLSGMLLAQLQKLAGEVGISGTGRMRKSELIAAIGQRQSGAAPHTPASSTSAAEAAFNQVSERPRASRPASAASEGADQVQLSMGEANTMSESAGSDTAAESGTSGVSSSRPRRRATRQAGTTRADTVELTAPPIPTDAPSNSGGSNSETSNMDGDGDRAGGRRGGGRDSRRSPQRRSGDRNDRGGDRGDRGDRAERNDRGGDRAERGDRNDRGPDRFDSSDEDGDFGRRRGRGGRFRDRDRDRNRRGGNGGGGGRDRNESEPTVGDDDVLLPVAGIVDILDNYAFIRTSGYLAGPNDVYVSLSQVRKYGIRRGDAVTGQVRQPRDGERQNKYNPLIRLETLNGVEADQAQRRPEFHKLTPLYPQDRLRLETEPQQLTTRVIDLVMPIGKGQRALIVSPPKAGKTMVLQALANAITTNNPECHLMVVLVDERPEEVTDMQRTVKGEVIASTFDRPPTDHTTVAELSIERAKRLVELGHDVVVLLDSITRLGRAYNLAAPASGRILSGGVDSTALYPPKRFLGAARNIEHGGSLTIIATALVETGSTMDTVIFEEFKGTGNAELKLDRRIADKRTFPAVDVDASSTRKEELLLASDELAIIYKLRKVLHALDSQQALDLVLDKLKKTRTNAEFLMQIQKTTPDNGND